MAARAATPQITVRTDGPSALPSPVSSLLLAGGLLVLGCFGGLCVALLGPAALGIPILFAIAAFLVVAPSRLVMPLLVVGIVFEPNAIDFTQPIADIVWLPPANVPLPLTVSSFEILLLVLATSLIIRGVRSHATPLPPIAWGIALMLTFGLLYGLYYSAPYNLAYHEARGLLFGILAFVVAWRMPELNREYVIKWLLVASTALGATLLARYLFLIRTGATDVAPESAFAHEDAVFLAFGFVLGCLVFFRAESLPPRIFAVLHNVLVFSALVGSSRRAATLALVVGLGTVALMTFPRRPGLVIAISAPTLLIGSVYVAAYWNQEYGAMAQPARAIRSQISPSERDENSDTYRMSEVYNVEQTIRFNRIFGIGFGHPFGQFQPLPDLTGGWPLQYYTPHQNILWLWLKMGALGVTVFLAAWVIAFRRCLIACRGAPAAAFPVIPIIIGAGLVMYLVYTKVDLALVPTRSAAAFAVLIAVSYRLVPGGAASPEQEEPQP